MAERLYDPRFQISDANGAPYSGALLYTYVAGTSTPLATYSDAALTAPNANPIVCDSSGRVPDVFLANASYRIVTKTAAGVTLWTADPVSATAPPASAGFRNVLINGNFQVNQRIYVSGVATTIANQYTLDRWRVVTLGQNATFVASGNGYIVTAPAGGLEQVVEGSNVFGGTYVLNWLGTATATVGGTARAKGEAFTIAANTQTTIRFSNGTVGQAQLEIGDLITAFESRHIGAELMLCQRYYVVVSAQIIGYQSAGSPTGCQICFPVAMRATPTVSASGASTPAFVNVTSEAPQGVTSMGFRYDITVTATGGASSVGRSYQASAEL